MPVEWPFAKDVIRLGGTGRSRITVEDALRQQQTAAVILEELGGKPGIILADEVGMGKTYVALAVVASVVRATRREGRPVVVMVPRGLVTKWQREWEQFKRVNCEPAGALDWIRTEYARRPTDFFKLVGRSRATRPHIIWTTTSCFHHGLADPWVKLALVRLARSHTKLDSETKKRIYKWATSLVRLRRHWRLTPRLIEQLLTRDVSRWRALLVQEGILNAEDEDPVPQHLVEHRLEIDWSPLIKVLRAGSIPGRQGAVSSERLREARLDFNDACEIVYKDWLRRAEWRAPLLVLDEAHHAKNDKTRLASLFRDDETKQLLDVQSGRPPLLYEKFDRMLFLTATPFQLGHQELVRVLRSFGAARWRGSRAPVSDRPQFRAAMSELERRLGSAREAARRLDRLWGDLAYGVVGGGQPVEDAGEAAVAWWARVREGDIQPADRMLLAAIDDCRERKAYAQTDDSSPWHGLRSWVVRHNRPAIWPGDSGAAVVRRRHLLAGQAIRNGAEGADALEERRSVGLSIVGNAALPFLLAARAQGELAYGSNKGRAFFAEGLCSSYEAFHHTRETRGDPRDVTDEVAESTQRTRERSGAIVPISWYEEHIAEMIPSKARSQTARFEHPKIRPVVERVLELWKGGEKVVVFCFYRETARALREHILREVDLAIHELAAAKLGLALRDSKQLDSWFTAVARRLADPESPFYKAIVNTLLDHLREPEFKVLRSREDEFVQLLAAYVRSPSFIARYLPLEVPAVRKALWEGSTIASVARSGARELERVLREVKDASDMTMHARVGQFLRFAAELAERGPVASDENADDQSDPLTEYLKAIAAPVGRDDEDEVDARASFRAAQPVRMVFGDTKPETRERVMLAFNSPMFPEILVSSAVLGEGVDLHRFCRYVIHHDLSWNPSTIEQRTGRLDRIRCKAELLRRPIMVYEPFIAGSADEKMYRVLRDRERWFQIVMGQGFESMDEATSERLANRVPLPEELARELVFDLGRSVPADLHESSAPRPGLG